MHVCMYVCKKNLPADSASNTPLTRKTAAAFGSRPGVYDADKDFNLHTYIDAYVYS